MSNRPPVVAITATELSSRWQVKAADFGWAFPSDWFVPAVEAVCETIVVDGDVWAAAERLGRSRAAAGVSLAETLVDVDGLATLVAGRYTDPLRRAVSLGWADRMTAPPSSVADPLTGLVTPEYLQVRLGEVYRSLEVRTAAADQECALVVIRLDLDGHGGWQRTLPMILVADGMRRIFDAGQTLALLGESVAVALCERDAVLDRRARLLCSMVTDQIDRDPQLMVPGPVVWVESLPPRYGAALELIAELGR